LNVQGSGEEGRLSEGDSLFSRGGVEDSGGHGKSLGGRRADGTGKENQPKSGRRNFPRGERTNNGGGGEPRLEWERRDINLVGVGRILSNYVKYSADLVS